MEVVEEREVLRRVGLGACVVVAGGEVGVVGEGVGRWGVPAYFAVFSQNT